MLIGILLSLLGYMIGKGKINVLICLPNGVRCRLPVNSKLFFCCVCFCCQVFHWFTLRWFIFNQVTVIHLYISLLFTAGGYSRNLRLLFCIHYRSSIRWCQRSSYRRLFPTLDIAAIIFLYGAFESINCINWIEFRK